MNTPTTTHRKPIVAVVGSGEIGSLHVELHSKTLGIEQVVVIELDDTRRTLFEKQGHIVFPSIEASLSGAIDIYDICLPTFLHKQAIELILEKTPAKILCEKPLTLNATELEALYARFPSTSSRVACAFVERFNEPFIKAKKWTKKTSGPYTMSFTRRTKKPLRQDWFKDPQKGGDVILDLGIHDIDASVWFSESTFDSVISYTSKPDNEVLQVSFKDGSIATYEVGWDIPQTSEQSIINHFTIEAKDSAFHYESSNEAVTIDTKSHTVTPRFPKAYQDEMNAAQQLPKHHHAAFPTTSHIKEGYAIITALKEQRHHE